MNDVLGLKFISLTMRLLVYTSIILTIATYACEASTLTKQLERRLAIFANDIRYTQALQRPHQIWSYRRMASASQSGTTAVVTAGAHPWIHMSLAATVGWTRIQHGPLGGWWRADTDDRRLVGLPRLLDDYAKQHLARLEIADPERWIEDAQDRLQWNIENTFIENTSLIHLYLV